MGKDALQAVVSTNSATLVQRQGPLCPETHLPLIPVSCLIHRNNGLNRRQLICIGLHTDPGVEAQREQVINNLRRTEGAGRPDMIAYHGSMPTFTHVIPSHKP